ncbi:unnamed protein product, partial [Cladocopium goreaui]
GMAVTHKVSIWLSGVAAACVLFAAFSRYDAWTLHPDDANEGDEQVTSRRLALEQTDPRLDKLISYPATPASHQDNACGMKNGRSFTLDPGIHSKKGSGFVNMTDGSPQGVDLPTADFGFEERRLNGATTTTVSTTSSTSSSTTSSTSSSTSTSSTSTTTSS